MTYDAKQIANWFVTRAQRDGKTLSIMSLLKLTYIAHGWHLETSGKPLFHDGIEAWQYGPVIPNVYRLFRGNSVNVTKTVEAKPVSKEVSDFLDQVYEVYGDISPFKLSDMTHEEDGPWDRARKREGWFSAISNADILEHYRAKRILYSQGAAT